MQTQSQVLRTQVKADPRLILANTILHMSCTELQEAIDLELLENPLLERSEDEFCEKCGEPPARCKCHLPLPERRVMEDGVPDRYESGTSVAASDYSDPLGQIEQRPTLGEHLMWQARAVAETRLHKIIEFLVSCLNHSGYLTVSVEDVVRILGVPAEDVEAALAVVQSLDPIGVGARDLRECLLIQIRALERDEEQQPHPLARAMIEDCWKPLSSNKIGALAKILQVSQEEAEEGVAWIRKTLCPHPGENFREPWETDRHRSEPSIRPDVLVSYGDDGSLIVTVLDHERTQLRLDAEYTRLLRQMQADPGSFPEAERKALNEYWMRAHMFMRSLGQRKELLLRVTECILEHQEAFFRSLNPHDLAPLTQTNIAAMLHVHESTVSRTVAEKYLQMPDGDVVPFSFFFGRATNLKQMVAELIEAEDRRRPLSDQRISDILKERGYQVARRTVMKYREELNILSTRQRALR